jgi:hypothetical protein
MNIYTSTLLLGVAGMLVMALGGLGRQGRGGASRNPAHGRGPHPGRGHSATRAHRAHTHHATGFVSRTFWQLTSPRFLFSVLIGFGTTGVVLGARLGALTPVIALIGGIAFERLVVTPVWNFALRFASRPALTLESVIADQATAVTAFDANGEGIISVELDGQVVHVLARLQNGDRALGMRIRKGQRVRVEEVDAIRNRCTVSLV